MKKFLNLLLALVAVVPVLAGGVVKEDRICKSAILKMDRKYSVYLPEGYETSSRHYPVLYLLHGAGDDHTGWVQFGEVCHIADKAVAEGKATPMIIIMPDANTTQRGYFNDPAGVWRYEDFFFEELIPHVEKTYKCRTEQRYRAIAGLSMGGGGTLYYTLHRPDLFAAACPLSPFVGVDREQVMIRAKQWTSTAGTASPGQLDQFVARYCLEPLVESLTDEQLKAVGKVRWFVDCGDDDFLYKDAALIHNMFRDKKIPHEYRVRDGAHNWTYWRASLPVVLEFVSGSFHQM